MGWGRPKGGSSTSDGAPVCQGVGLIRERRVGSGAKVGVYCDDDDEVKDLDMRWLWINEGCQKTKQNVSMRHATKHRQDAFVNL